MSDENVFEFNMQSARLYLFVCELVSLNNADTFKCVKSALRSKHSIMNYKYSLMN